MQSTAIHSETERPSTESRVVLRENMAPILGVLDSYSAAAAELATSVQMHANKKVNSLGLDRNKVMEPDYTDLNNAYTLQRLMTDQMMGAVDNNESTIFNNTAAMAKLAGLRVLIDLLEALPAPMATTQEPIFSQTAKDNIVRVTYQIQLTNELYKCKSIQDFYTFLNLWLHLDLLFALSSKAIDEIHTNMRSIVLEQCGKLFDRDPNLAYLKILILNPSWTTGYIN